ncbi:MAG: family transposase [Microvirga sp.]|nr:family transposase [Microvirga sp.]
MPPSYVKPYAKRQKNDAADAEAVCEAVTRPTMRFVEVKTVLRRALWPAVIRTAPTGPTHGGTGRLCRMFK